NLLTQHRPLLLPRTTTGRSNLSLRPPLLPPLASRRGNPLPQLPLIQKPQRLPQVRAQLPLVADHPPAQLAAVRPLCVHSAREQRKQKFPREFAQRALEFELAPLARGRGEGGFVLVVGGVVDFLF